MFAAPGTSALSRRARLVVVAFAAFAVLFTSALAVGAPPTTEEEFAERLKTEATTPEGALGLWFDGVFLYSNKETRELGALILAEMMVGADKKWDRQRTFYTFSDRLKNKAHIFRSYAKGSSPANGYSIDLATYALNIDESGEDATGFFFALQSSGADRTRKIFLKLDEESGRWKVLKFGSIYLVIKKAE